MSKNLGRISARHRPEEPAFYGDKERGKRGERGSGTAKISKKKVLQASIPWGKSADGGSNMQKEGGSQKGATKTRGTKRWDSVGPSEKDGEKASGNIASKKEMRNTRGAQGARQGKKTQSEEPARTPKVTDVKMETSDLGVNETANFYSVKHAH